MRVVLTHNHDKENDFVNGMGAVVDAFNEERGCMEVITDTGKRLSFGKRTSVVEVPIPDADDDEVKKWTVAAFPVRVGYASTVYKVQGMTLDHVTIWLDIAGARAAGYVALSRVKHDGDYLIAGKMSPAHFTPATGLPGHILFFIYTSVRCPWIRPVSTIQRNHDQRNSASPPAGRRDADHCLILFFVCGSPAQTKKLCGPDVFHYMQKLLHTMAASFTSDL